MNRRNLRQNHGRIRNSALLDVTKKEDDAPEETEEDSKDLELFVNVKEGRPSKLILKNS